MPQTPDRPVFEQFTSNPPEFPATYICPGLPGEMPHEFLTEVPPLGIDVLPLTQICPKHHRTGNLADPNLLPHA